ncbi:MAG: isoleucine--tRNA ligase [Candidatus Ancaeobacter aquaticus]|nr:isoleucine--tRNA ligase [Candidatus Ancaeobacter aquaticus]
MNYKDTINLPQTAFPMKAALKDREPVILSQWKEKDMYKALRENKKGKKKFILHDGPPYANGNIHIGHALNKILKDVVIKYKTLRGYDAPYVPGWDCHGLPVEHQLFKELNKTKHDVDHVEFRKSARKYASKYVDIQKEQFKRLGVFGDWEKPYLTMNSEYVSAIIRSFSQLYKKGYIYRGLKPIYWCCKCETALAEAEIEYAEHSSPSIHVAFDFVDSFEDIVPGVKDVSIVIWTTTPWTIPANMATAVAADLSYAIVRYHDGSKERVVIILEELIGKAFETIGITHYEVIHVIKGKELEGRAYKHPFMDRVNKVVLCDFIDTSEGVGCVHIAPGHGQDDFKVGKKYNLDVFMPVNDKGLFTEAFPGFEGVHVFKANDRIIDILKDKNALLFAGKTLHSYPYCWRCKSPVIFRATPQWFIDVDSNNLRQDTLQEIKNVKWIPNRSEGRISAMVEGRPDWCLSRQRLWGVPIPAFYCKKCNTEIITEEILHNFEKMVEQSNEDVWFEKDPKEFLPEGFTCPHCSHSEFIKEKDILDVWFDSGVSHQAVLEKREELLNPADLYLEGSDQHRGWFQSAILTAMGIMNKPSYKSVLTHGFVVDGEGKKMSKSRGNVVSPLDTINSHGADILRLWVASVDYTDDVRISKEIVEQLADAYRKMRNTIRYLLGNICDFDLQENKVPYEKLTSIDKWALSHTYLLLEKVTEHYEAYDFYKAYRAIYNYCVVDMSSFYFDILKDRLYTAYRDSRQRRSAQTVLHEILLILVKVLSPILSFTAEEVWGYIDQKSRDNIESVHMSSWPSHSKDRIDNTLEKKWSKMIEVRKEVLKVLEEMRKNKVIGNSLQARVCLCAENEEIKALLDEYKDQLQAIFIVSDVEFCSREKVNDNFTNSDTIANFFIYAEKAHGEKCERCWCYSVSVGEHSEHKTICQKCVNAITQGA